MINSDAAVRLFYLKTAIELIALIFSIGAAATTIYCALDARATQRETVAIVDRQVATVRQLCASNNPETIIENERIQ